MHRLPRLPTGALLTLCERSGKKHLILQNPSRYSLEELNFLGDSAGFGSGFHRPLLGGRVSFGTPCCFTWDPLLLL